MAMLIDWDKGVLRFDIPNSEANISAQHNGIIDRSVGSYYMSDHFEDCKLFLSDFEGSYFIDIDLCIANYKRLQTYLVAHNLSKAYKQELKPQAAAVDALQWFLESGEYYYEIEPPIVNSQQKYLKLNNEDNCIGAIKTLLLGDLMSLCFKKVGKNGYLIYIDICPKFDEYVDSNTILKWLP